MRGVDGVSANALRLYFQSINRRFFGSIHWRDSEENMSVQLQDANGDLLVVDEGESCNLSGALVAPDGTALLLANISTLLLTLYDGTTYAVLNSRNGQNAKNANSHTVASDGTVTIRLDPADAVWIGNRVVDAKQPHVARLTWTWSDGVETRTGKEDLIFQVQCAAVPV